MLCLHQYQDVPGCLECHHLTVVELLTGYGVGFKTICATLAYSMILGDTFVSLLSTAGTASSKLPVTIGLMSIMVLPLCLMKNLSSLAPFSRVWSLGMTLPKYYKVVPMSFAISIAIFSLIASIGNLTFGSHASGLILNNYSTRDGSLSLSRIAVAVSRLFCYPLASVGARLDLLKLKGTRKTQNVLTVALLSAIIAVHSSFLMSVLFWLLRGLRLGTD
jgi:hypothetical protein